MSAWRYRLLADWKLAPAVTLKAGTQYPVSSAKEASHELESFLFDAAALNVPLGTEPIVM